MKIKGTFNDEHLTCLREKARGASVEAQVTARLMFGESSGLVTIVCVMV